jgi:hypothetical protein
MLAFHPLRRELGENGNWRSETRKQRKEKMKFPFMLLMNGHSPDTCLGFRKLLG